MLQIESELVYTYSKAAKKNQRRRENKRIITAAEALWFERKHIGICPTCCKDSHDLYLCEICGPRYAVFLDTCHVSIYLIPNSRYIEHVENDMIDLANFGQSKI